MRQADNILEVIWVGYRIFEPFSIFRNLNLNFNQWTEWNFGGELTGPGGNINAHTQLKNYWNFHWGVNINGEGLSSAELRGGPALKVTGTKNMWFAFGSNDQKRLTGEAQFMVLGGNENNSKKMFDCGISFGYRPSKNLKITLSPNFNKNNDEMQYVTQQDYSNKTDYIFARIHQRTLSASLRINYIITPNLSIQYWGQPFLASGKYTEFKRITNSRANKYTDRFALLGGNELVYNAADEIYQVSDLTGNQLYTFDQPDFNFKEFLSNMVIRWEYLPGSTIYLVWSQNRNQSVANGSFHFRDDLNDLFNEKPYNVFLVKMSFRLGR